MKVKKMNFKLESNNKFNMIDKFASKLLIISLSAIIVFNISNYMMKSNYFAHNLINVNAESLSLKFKTGIFSNKNISIHPFDDKFNYLDTDDVYNEIIYFTNNKDLGELINKSVNLIDFSSLNIGERYIEVLVKNYDSGEDFFIMQWDRNNSLNYSVYIN